MGDRSSRTQAVRTYSVGQVARAAGVTVRTLHHYDAIGLLRPSGRTPSGYRTYDEADVHQLQRILGYRELGFALEDVATLLGGDGDPVDHLRRQRALLLRRIEHLQRMVATLDKTMEAHQMGIRLTPEEMLEVFGEHDPTEFAEEAEERWGDTDAWRESQRRTSSYTKDDWLRIKAEADGLNQRFVAAFTAGSPADGVEAMDLAEEHRRHIHRWFYDCGYPAHRGLADLYVSDPRFTANYDESLGAPGLAQYVHDAIYANAERAES